MHPGGEVLEFRLRMSEFSKLKSLDIGSRTPSSLGRFFRHNRLGGRLHSYDLVEGPLLGNPRSFLKGSQPRTFGQQSSFHTPHGLRLLEEGLVMP